MKKTDTTDGFARFAKMENVLEKINAETNWEIFRWLILWLRQNADHAPWYPPWDEITMFKTTLLQHWNELSDKETESMISDWLAFQRFLGLGPGDKSPDADMIWLFKQELGQEGMAELMNLFDIQLETLGVGQNRAIPFAPKPRKIFISESGNFVLTNSEI